MDTNSRSAWTDAALEAFLDGALGEADAAELGEALREDPALRARLAEIRRGDEVMLEALLTAVEDPRPRARGTGAGVWAVAAAACVAVAGGVWIAGGVRGAGGSAPEPAEGVVHKNEVDGRGEADVEEEVYDPVPVVLVVKLPARGAALGGAAAGGNGHGQSESGGESARGVEGRLAEALAAGDVAAAVALIDGAGARAQEGAYRQIGELMRSAAIAEKVLDSMAPAQQLAACRLWAEDPKLRTVVFPRLAALGRSGELGEELAAVVREMSEREELRPWLRSYGLAAGAAVRGWERRG